MIDPDSYSLVVVFRRQHSDDDDIVKERGWEVTPATLAKQFALEMQAAFDDGGIAGFFQVVEVVEGDALFQVAEGIAKGKWETEGGRDAGKTLGCPYCDGEFADLRELANHEATTGHGHALEDAL